jgi:5-methylcytosine-specific restriction endonuclease McrBC regulatory subunit McrC
MPSEIEIKESTWTEVDLTIDQALVLTRLGRELVSAEQWWGEAAPAEARSAIEFRRAPNGNVSVFFREVVGVVRLGDLHIKVVPKIAESHFNFIVSHGELLPRISPLRADLASGVSLPQLVAHWCVWAVEEVLRRGLGPGYEERYAELEEVRGRLDPIATTLLIQSGRAVAACEFEELGIDTPLNRILLAACRRVAGFSEFGMTLRRRANRLVQRMEGVGPLRHSDRLARVDRLTKKYSDALVLARIVLSGGGIESTSGDCAGSAFLIRTPEIVEDGLRQLLAKLLLDTKIAKRRLRLGDSGLTLNPDLSFNGREAIGDIKYQMLSSDWHRPNLYQAVAFATGFGSSKCAIFGFVPDSSSLLPRATLVGNVHARSFGWIADEACDPVISAKLLADSVRGWLAPT